MKFLPVAKFTMKVRVVWKSLLLATRYVERRIFVVELAVVIGKEARDCVESQAMEHIAGKADIYIFFELHLMCMLGYALAIDLTARNLQVRVPATSWRR